MTGLLIFLAAWAAIGAAVAAWYRAVLRREPELARRHHDVSSIMPAAAVYACVALGWPFCALSLAGGHWKGVR